jgi:BirA family transcriptional regulator, biotin operon repressor / biotin---[acetyl-CoA-carboxylase] ligase
MTRFGSPRRHLRSTGSTNDVARELALAGAPSGSVVTASEQTAGRGRRGRTWSSPAETALLASAILRPLDPRHRLLPLAVPVAVCEAIGRVSGRRCEIKWPNDVWIEERKVAGVLIEARPPDWAVIGVGINLAIGEDEFPADLRWPATSIGGGVTVARMLEALCEELGGWVEAEAPAVLAAFRERDALRGRRIGWAAGNGTAAGIDDDGDLLVETTAGECIPLGAGEVQLQL